MKCNRRMIAAVLLPALYACAVGSDYKRPPVDTPANYAMGASSNLENGTSIAEQSWQQVFTDSQLQSLIQEALSKGPQVLLAAAQLRQSQAQAGISRSALFPSLAASIDSSPTPRGPGDSTAASYSGTLGLAWEIDLWGRYRRANEAARARLLATEYALYGLQASLVAGVASNYYQLRALTHSLEKTRLAVVSQTELLTLIERMATAGLATAAQVAQQKSVLESTRSNIPVLTQNITATENAITLLLGRVPGTLDIDFTGVQDLAGPTQIPVGLPSQLLERRPDLQEAEAKLKAANASVGEARAMFFPSIGLTALTGGISDSLSQAVQGRASVVSIGPKLTQVLFSGGQIVYNEKLAKAQFDAAVTGYQQAILQALNDVVLGLVAHKSTSELVQIQADRIAAAQQSLKLTDMQFRAGIIPLTDVLSSQQQLYAAEIEAIQAGLQNQQALINLYAALGGGWSDNYERD